MKKEKISMINNLKSELIKTDENVYQHPLSQKVNFQITQVNN